MTRKHVANLDEVASTEARKGSHRYTRKQVGAAAGGRQLGCSHMVLPPGAVSFPFHWHGANEEAIFVIAGRGTLRIGAERVAVRSGDWIAMPCGPEHAHQMVNDSDAPLEYLCVSTMIPVEVWGYPDSHKIGFTAAPPGSGPAERYVMKFVKDDANVDYYADEPLATE
jgi:uncharacterized cupin superfamily protein